MVTADEAKRIEAWADKKIGVVLSALQAAGVDAGGWYGLTLKDKLIGIATLAKIGRDAQSLNAALRLLEAVE